MAEYRTPGVYVEEVTNGPRPVRASSTTETGFVGILTLPQQFFHGRGVVAGMVLPGAEDVPLLAWNRAVAFRALETSAPSAPKAAPSAEAKADKADKAEKTEKAEKAPPRAENPSGSRLSGIVRDTLPGEWDILAPNGGDASLTLKSRTGQLLRLPVRRTLLSVKTSERGSEWELAFGAEEQQFVELLAAHAIAAGIKHTGKLLCVDESRRPASVDANNIQERLQKVAPVVQSFEGFDRWRLDFGANLFKEILLEVEPSISEVQADAIWESLPRTAANAWNTWLRAHPGMQRIELAIRGFFENGGRTAYIAMGVQAHGAAGPAKRKFLQDSFDGISALAMLAAPGLDLNWQQALLEYAGPRGRGDLFAILETPRYLLTRAPRGRETNAHRWIEVDSPYESGVLTTLASAEANELRFAGFSADEVLDRCIPRDDTGFGAAYGPWVIVENPLSTGPHDRYVVAPPAGHIAGMIAATDLKAGGGVHKAPANEQLYGVAGLATSVSDREQESLNVKGINIVRFRPAAGIRVWGARTVAADPLWTYVNVRRLFLFIERSIREAVQWAVFLPNNDLTRRDLRDTIFAFLFRLHRQGMLDGSTPSEAFQVKCDRDNNPDPDVRSGILTVDIEVRPVYPAEFIRLRFRQSPMQIEA